MDCAERQDVKDATLMVRNLRNLCQSQGEHRNQGMTRFDCDLCGQRFKCEENLKQHKESVEHQLQEVLQLKETNCEEDDLNPGERARALDQGDASICTMYAVANATVESLTLQDIDISLEEFVGALKQNEQLDLDNGNNVEEFNNVRIKNMTNKKSKKYGDIELDIERITKKLQRINRNTLNEKTKTQYEKKIVVVYNQVIGDPKTKHAVALKNFETIDGRKMIVCINSHGDSNPLVLLELDRPEKYFYSLFARWTPVKNTELNPLVTAVTRDNRETETSPPTNSCWIS